MGAREKRFELWQAAAGLLLRADCLCCGRLVGLDSDLHSAGAAVHGQLCEDCGAELQQQWVRADPPVLAVPVFAAGAYGGVRRALILAMKERLRPAAFVVAARVLEAGIIHLAGRAVVPDPRWGEVVLVPAPSRRQAARRRGGDVVSRMCHLVAERNAGVRVFDVAYMQESARDSVGLNRAERRANVSANIRVLRPVMRELLRVSGESARVVIVDDVCTTGATIVQFATVLRANGVTVAAALVLASA